MKHIRNRYFLLTDLTLVSLSAYLSFILRLDSFYLRQYESTFLLFAGAALVLIPGVFVWMGIYARYWRYASIEEFLILAGATTGAVALSSLATLAVCLFAPAIPILPRSIPFIFLPLALVAAGAPRVAARLTAYYDRKAGAGRVVEPVQVLVAGAGEAGAMILRETQRNPQLGLTVVGFLDDDPRKRGMHIRGVPVVGTRHDLPEVVEDREVDQVVIAMPTAPGKVIREILDACREARVRVQVMPGLFELLNGTVSINQLREVQIEDLLRREAVQTDVTGVDRLIRGRRVLVTGGGGSIGSELCRQILGFGPASLTLVGHGENSVFQAQHELERLAAQLYGRSAKGLRPRVASVIGDIRFPERLRGIFAEHRPELVFHAAAHKHVPLMELNPADAVTNNILGTQCLLEASLAAGVRHFVMISTDKAVNPTSVMGATKRTAELLVHRAAAAGGRPYVAVRFGNVLGSRGSVVHLFKEQIAAGGPITITHPDMRRFFMTIPEAVQLVLQAAALGEGGEVFVLDMGEPIRIVDLAQDLIRLSGRTVGRDLDIVFSGVRPGEKLLEELFVTGEEYRRTAHDKIFLAANASSFIPPGLVETVAELEAAARRNDRAAIIRGLKSLIPEFQPQPLPVEQVPEDAWLTQTLSHGEDLLPGDCRRGDPRLLETLLAHIEAKEARDLYGGQHSARVTRIALAFGRTLGLPPGSLESLKLISALHDLGKVGISDHILLKTDPLAVAERSLIETHPLLGEQLAAPLGLLPEERQAIRHHHERWDGRGYPGGLKERDIPLPARILALADSFDAITSDRPYRLRASVPQALEEIRAGAGTQFDPDLAARFVAMVAESRPAG